MDPVLLMATSDSLTGFVASGAPGGMSDVQLVMLAGGIIGLTILLISTRRRMHKSLSGTTSSARDKYESLSRQSSAKREVGNVMLELEKLARHVNGQLDTRFAKLEAVIRDADARIAQLSQLSNALAPKGKSLDNTLNAEPPADSNPPLIVEADSRYADIYDLADGGLKPGDIAEKTGKTVGEIELILALRRTRSLATQIPEIKTKPTRRKPKQRAKAP